MDFQRRRVWQDDEIQSLLNSWKSQLYKKRPRKKRLIRRPLYIEISKDLLEQGYKRSEREIMIKIENLVKKHSRAKQCKHVEGPFITKWFDQVDEILNLEIEIHKREQASESQTEPAQELINGPNVKKNAPETIKDLLVRTNIVNNENSSEPELLSYTLIESAESEVPSNCQLFQVSLPELSSSNFQNNTDSIMKKFCREFQRSNRQLEKNDREILELFKQQNEIFRTQTTLLMKLLSK